MLFRGCGVWLALLSALPTKAESLPGPVIGVHIGDTLTLGTVTVGAVNVNAALVEQGAA